MHDRGVQAHQIQAVLSGIRELLSMAGAGSQIEVKNFGNWNQFPGRDYGTVDWYIQRAAASSMRPDQLDALKLLADTDCEPWKETTPHYDVFVTSYDINSGEANNNFVLGLTHENMGTVLSTWRYRSLPSDMRFETLKTLTMHELGHVFGLPNESRTNLDNRYGGAHCSNICIMRQGITVDAWVKITKNRLEHGPLCNECQRDLQEHFR